MPTNKGTYMKDYYAKNKERILLLLKEKSAEKIHCEDCNKSILKTNEYQHKRTKGHKFNESKKKRRK